MNPGRRLTTRRLLLAAALLLLLGAGAVVFAVFWRLPDVSFLKNPRTSFSIVVRDWQGKEHPFVVGPKNRDWTPHESIPATLKWAVIVAEDAGFYGHQGIDMEAMREALRHDLEQKRLARGASTITQQLAKNLFLSREKTVLRKLREIVLARRMEASLSKARILELYLNVVELGPRVHGVGAGARYHFDKNPAELTAAEGATLAAILPGPRLAYNPRLKPEKVRRRAARIVALLEQRRALSPAAAAEALRQLRGATEPAPASEEELATPERDEEVPAAEETAPLSTPATVEPSTPAPEPAADTPGNMIKD